MIIVINVRDLTSRIIVSSSSITESGCVVLENRAGLGLRASGGYKMRYRLVRKGFKHWNQDDKRCSEEGCISLDLPCPGLRGHPGFMASQLSEMPFFLHFIQAYHKLGSLSDPNVAKTQPGL